MPLQTYGNTFGPPQKIDYNNLMIGPKIKRLREQNAFNQQKIGIAQQASTRADEAAARSQTQLGLNEQANTRAQETHTTAQVKAKAEEYRTDTHDIAMLLDKDKPAKFLKEAPGHVEKLKKKYEGMDITFGLSLLNGLAAKATEAVKGGDPQALKAWSDGVQSIKAAFDVARVKTEKPTGPTPGTEPHYKMLERQQAIKDGGKGADDKVGDDVKFNATQMQRMRQDVKTKWGWSDAYGLDEEKSAKANETQVKARKYMEEEDMNMDEAIDRAYTDVRVKHAVKELPKGVSAKKEWGLDGNDDERASTVTKIKELMEMGMPEEQVKGVLQGKGWEEEDIVKIMEALKISPEKPVSEMDDEDVMKKLGL